MSANDILFRHYSTGASQVTAWPQSRRLKDKKIVGVEASHALAQEDLPKLKPFLQQFKTLAQSYNLPPALLAAIASRETRGGTALDSDGWGRYDPNGFGLMQVDKQNHPKGGPYSFEHLKQATEILSAAVKGVKEKHRDWSAALQLRGAVAAYNFGVKNVWTIDGLDKGSTGDDYSSDIWARAQFLAPHFGGADSGQVAVVPPPPPPEKKTAPKTLPGEAASRSLPVVHDLQALLVRHGYMTEAEVKTGPGVLGPKTRAAIARFMADRSHPQQATPTPATPQQPVPSVPTPPVTAGATEVLAQGLSVNTHDPILKKLATERLNTGKDHSCVRTTLDNMARLGVSNIPSSTGGDKNNSRGAMVQLLANGHWVSLPLVGAHERQVKSPYGTVSAHVIGGAEYKKLALAGKIPSGAIIFQTKHGWDYGAAPYGNDMGIVRDNGRVTFNYEKMPPIVYGTATKEVVLVLPKSAIVKK